MKFLALEPVPACCFLFLSSASSFNYMVFTGSDVGDSMALGPDRLKPLHNFTLPRLKWGTQRHLRCTKLPDGDRRSPSPTEFHDGIDAVREKLMLDLKKEADKIKDAILGKELAHHSDVLLHRGSPEEDAPPSLTGARTWNLRTRRAPLPDNGVRIDDRRAAAGARPSLSPSPSPLKENEERRTKFSLSLNKKEIEEDFLKMSGHRPPRRPKKRPRNVQKQIDNLFPGLWLSEVSADCYKVPDDADTAKR